MLVAPIRAAVQFASVSIKAATATVRYTMVKAHSHHYTDTQKAKIRSDYLAAVGAKVAFKIREAGNLAVNWGKALQQTMRHVCDPKTTKARDKGSTLKPISFGGGGVASWNGTSSTSNQPQSKGKDDSKRKQLTDSELQALIKKAQAGDMSAVHALAGNFNISDGVGTYNRTKAQIAADNQHAWDTTVKAAKTLVGEVTGWYNAKRLWTGKDPVTGEDANRWWAGVGLALDGVGYLLPIAKLGKLVKGGKVTATAAKTIDTVDDVSDAVKAVDVVDDVSDTSRAFKAADAVNDGKKALTGQEVVDEFVKGLDDMTIGSGRRNYRSSGGYNQAVKDFDSLKLSNVETRIIDKGNLKVGTLPDGTKVVVRDFSSSGKGATLEFQLKQKVQ
ncbi:hypothetical protein BU202_00095 [Streptococcus cuniculi]|uniref:Pre-toxin TG domain-containing protein n=1 Tax=Streptococcus cuniculi TaxID=1432788 RepID=A0A1Q8EAB2_9STRE|nr:pre-toxin TG domain-containing protein [Streptococcus cuniculi]OLF48731.1 hypothetical protein BU202_00095 [Streptococcus cuniculi]